MVSLLESMRKNDRPGFGHWGGCHPACWLRSAIRRVCSSVSVMVFVGLLTTISAARRRAAFQSDPVFKALLLDGRTAQRPAGFARARGDHAGVGGGRQARAAARAGVQADSRGLGHGRGDRSLDVVLPEGDCLMRVTIGSASETALEVQSDALGKLAVPLDSLLGLIMVVPAETDVLDGLWDRVRLEPRKEEVVWLSNGDRIARRVSGLGRAQDQDPGQRQAGGDRAKRDLGGRVRSGAGQLSSAEVGFSGDLAQRWHEAGGRECEDRRQQGAEATSRFGEKVRFPLSELVSVHVRSTSYDYLTERTPIQAVYFPTSDRLASFGSIGRSTAIFSSSPGKHTTAGSARRAARCWRTGSNRGIGGFRRWWGLTIGPGCYGSVVFRVLVDKEERFKTRRFRP